MKPLADFGYEGGKVQSVLLLFHGIYYLILLIFFLLCILEGSPRGGRGRGRGSRGRGRARGWLLLTD